MTEGSAPEHRWLLPVCQSTRDSLVTSDGAPVWPIRDDTDRESLRAITRVFGTSIRPVRARRGIVSSGTETVLAIGGENEANARLYAHLTRRRAQVVRSVDALDEIEDPRVLVCQWRHLSFAALERIHRYGRSHHGVGLIVGHDPISMRAQLLTRAAGAVLRARRAASAVLVYPHLDLKSTAVGNLLVVRRGADALALRRNPLREPALLGLYGHGDGLDMELGARQVLCGAMNYREVPADYPRPDCVADGKGI